MITKDRKVTVLISHNHHHRTPFVTSPTREEVRIQEKMQTKRETKTKEGEKEEREDDREKT